jgi:hypothetical protein
MVSAPHIDTVVVWPSNGQSFCMLLTTTALLLSVDVITCVLIFWRVVSAHTPLVDFISKISYGIDVRTIINIYPDDISRTISRRVIYPRRCCHGRFVDGDYSLVVIYVTLPSIFFAGQFSSQLKTLLMHWCDRLSQF